VQDTPTTRWPFAAFLIVGAVISIALGWELFLIVWLLLVFFFAVSGFLSFFGVTIPNPFAGTRGIRQPMAFKRLPLSKLPVYGFWFVSLSWVFFGPMWAFHHVLAYGATSYLVFNDEGPDPDAIMWHGHQVRLFWDRLAIGILLWAGSLGLVFCWLKKNGFQTIQLTPASRLCASMSVRVSPCPFPISPSPVRSSALDVGFFRAFTSASLCVSAPLR